MKCPPSYKIYFERAYSIALYQHKNANNRQNSEEHGRNLNGELPFRNETKRRVQWRVDSEGGILRID